MVLPIVFAAAAAVLAGPGEIVGRCFTELPRLTAYRFDLVGSLIGIATFTGLSFLGAPPMWWGLIVSLAFALLLVPGARGAAVVVAVVLVAVPAASCSWRCASSRRRPAVAGRRTTRSRRSTGTGTAARSSTSRPTGCRTSRPCRRSCASSTSRSTGCRTSGLPHNALGNVLVVGAGRGTDVAIALRKGAKHVDAVEIDPRICCASAAS